MTVSELIMQLEQFDGALEVGFKHPSHDYWRTQLISTVDDMEEGFAVWSDYHSQFAVASERDIEEAEYLEENPDESAPKGKGVKRVLVLI
jgi:hypothetical protein